MASIAFNSKTNNNENNNNDKLTYELQQAENASPAIEIDRCQILQVIEQFLLENQLTSTLDTLIKETNVRMPGSNPRIIKTVVEYVKTGSWIELLKILKNYEISTTTLLLIYGQIVSELAENGKVTEAIEFLRSSKDFDQLKEENPKTYRRLESFAFNFDVNYNYKLDQPNIYAKKSNSLRQCKRYEIADYLAGELTIIPESRMLTMVSQAMKYKRLIGELPIDAANTAVKFNLVADQIIDNRKIGNGNIESVPKTKGKKIKLGRKGFPKCVIFNKNYIITGSVDGLIEIFDPITAKHARLEYQQKQNFILVESSILTMANNLDHTLIAVGTMNGCLSVYDIESGKIIRSFPNAHSQGISNIQFNPIDKSKILTCSLDKTARIFGLNSGQMLKEYRGHTSFVNSAKYNPNAELIYTVSSDATIKVWKTSTCLCIKTIGNELFYGNNNNNNNSASSSATSNNKIAVVDIIVLKKKIKGIIILNRTATMTLMTYDGNAILKRYVAKMSSNGSMDTTNNNNNNNNVSIFSSMMVSKYEILLHGIAENFVYSYNIENGNLLGILNTKDSVECLGICKSPTYDLYATYGKSGTIRFWESDE